MLRQFKELEFTDVSRFNNETYLYFWQVLEYAIAKNLLSLTEPSDDIIMRLFDLTEDELKYEYSELSAERRAYVRHCYVLFLFLSRGYETVTKTSQTFTSHIVRGVNKFFFVYSKRKLLISTKTPVDAYPNNRIMYVEKDYIKLMDYSKGIVPKDMLRNWKKIAKAFDFKLTQSESKLWFK